MKTAEELFPDDNPDYATGLGYPEHLDLTDLGDDGPATRPLNAVNWAAHTETVPAEDVAYALGPDGYYYLADMAASDETICTLLIRGVALAGVGAAALYGAYRGLKRIF
jgi:hypothetical protein